MPHTQKRFISLFRRSDTQKDLAKDIARRQALVCLSHLSDGAKPA